MKFKFNYKYYLRGTFIIMLCLIIVLVCFYPIAFKSNTYVRKIFFICFACFCLACIVGYWIYGFCREYNIYKRESKLKRVKKKEDKIDE